MNRLAQLDQSVTQTDRAYAALLEEILNCRLAPGAKITISEVATKLGFSPGAVREALSRLSAEKMAVATAQKGFSVAEVSIEELKDLTRTQSSNSAWSRQSSTAMSNGRPRSWRRTIACTEFLWSCPGSLPA